MKPKNLEFYKEVEGGKTHYIFTQDEMFYVFTQMDDDTRGNFFIIPISEVEETERRIADKYLREFHPRELDKFDFETDKEYRVQRIRSVCYILVAKRVLTVEKVGREILFNNINLSPYRVKTKSLKKHISENIINFKKSFKQTLEKHNIASLKNYSGNCPLCEQRVEKRIIKTHLKKTCPKR